MTGSTRKIFLSLLALALLTLQQTAPAQTPYFGTETGSYALTPTSPTTAELSGSAVGSDNLGGAFLADIAADLDFTDPFLQILSNGTFLRDYGGGDSLFGTFSGTFTITGPAAGAFTLPIVITGGTGRFASIAGSGLEEGTVAFTSPITADFTSGFRGTVVPEPGVSALMISGGFAGSLLALRRLKRRERHVPSA